MWNKKYSLQAHVQHYKSKNLDSRWVNILTQPESFMWLQSPAICLENYKTQNSFKCLLIENCEASSILSKKKKKKKKIALFYPWSITPQLLFLLALGKADFGPRPLAAKKWAAKKKKKKNTDGLFLTVGWSSREKKKRFAALCDLTENCNNCFSFLILYWITLLGPAFSFGGGLAHFFFFFFFFVLLLSKPSVPITSRGWISSSTNYTLFLRRLTTDPTNRARVLVSPSN